MAKKKKTSKASVKPETEITSDAAKEAEEIVTKAVVSEDKPKGKAKEKKAKKVTVNGQQYTEDQLNKKGKVKFSVRIKQFFKDLFAEAKKINWLKGKDLWRNTLVVVLVVLVIGIGVWIEDAVLVWLRELLYDASVNHAAEAEDATAALFMLKTTLGLY